MGHKLLIVDDSPVIFKLIKKKLLSNGIEDVFYAENGEAAVEFYKENHPDLVIMDITMPVKDGLEASKEIIAMHEKANIILLSSLQDEELMIRAKAIGVKDFLGKPFDMEEMIVKISTWLQPD